MDGEKIIATAHLHPIIFFWPAVLTLLVLSFGGGARWLVIIPLIWLGLVYEDYSSSEFAVTNRRIIAKWGGRIYPSFHGGESGQSRSCYH
jgi:hypothetical protein